MSSLKDTSKRGLGSKKEQLEKKKSQKEDVEVEEVLETPQENVTTSCHQKKDNCPLFKKVLEFRNALRTLLENKNSFVNTEEDADVLLDRLQQYRKVMNEVNVELNKVDKRVEKESEKVNNIVKRHMKKKQKRKKREVSEDKMLNLTTEAEKFFKLSKGEKVPSSYTTTEFYKYLKEHPELKSENGKVFHLEKDPQLYKLLGKPLHLINNKRPQDGKGYSFYNIKKYLTNLHVRN